ncbi:MAG: FKBP-type peptidyl-prolyl cis-trans isomerase [Pseudomonadales bacterium]
MADIPVGPGTKVTLRFSLEFEDGEVIDSTGDRAAEFVVGDGSLLPGFERAMFGLKAGDRERLFVEAAHGFGEPKSENIQRIKRSQFSPDMPLSEGLIVSFADQHNAELPGVICGMTEDLVEVDFNHPLSGKNLYFDVDIVAVEQVSDEILRIDS